MQSDDPYQDLLERARALAASKRASGEIPENTTEALDRLFIEIAPPGARVEDDSLEALVEVLARYQFDPSIQLESGRSGLARIVKRLLRPITSWQLRHLTDQMNAYSAAQAEILRALVRAAGERRPE